MKKYAIIVAGGSGNRFGSSLPKQFLDLCGRPVLWWSLKAFHEEDPSICLVLVLPESHVETWERLLTELPVEDRIPHTIALGGKVRTESVINGFKKIAPKEKGYVAVHDGARPLVTTEMIREGWKKAIETGVAIPTVPVTDSLREKIGDKTVSVDRNRFLAVQTPQILSVDVMNDIARNGSGKEYSDDASAAEALGYIVGTYPGDSSNIKITYPYDIKIAEILLSESK